VIALAAAVVIGLRLFSGLEPYRATPGKPVAYVGDRSCAECHAKQSKDWLGSNHQRAMQLATAETVLGDFNGAVFAQAGVTSRFFRRRPGSSSTRRAPTASPPTSRSSTPSAWRRYSSTSSSFPVGGCRA
jgi:hypothetical protein